MTDANACLVVVRATGVVSIQSHARYDRLHEGLPPGGPLAPALLERARQRIADGGSCHAGIEICGELVVRAVHDVIASTDRAARWLSAREEMTIASGPRRVAYLMIPSGVDARRSTYVTAGLGRVLRAGDRIHAAPDLMRSPQIVELAAEPASEDVIRVLPGPDTEAFAPGALELLASSAWRISPTSDRTGTRLVGPSIPRRADYVDESRPMVLGAIEVPRDGAPIVLGPEHPTTGGYPILAVVATSSLDAFHALPLGATVRFAL